MPAEDEELTCVFCQRNQTEGVVYKYFPESRLSPLCLLNHHDNIDRNDNTEGKHLKKKGEVAPPRTDACEEDKQAARAAVDFISEF